jgi:hypothetical protein
MIKKLLKFLDLEPLEREEKLFQKQRLFIYSTVCFWHDVASWFFYNRSVIRIMSYCHA